jgi:hypothetical protein
MLGISQEIVAHNSDHTAQTTKSLLYKQRCQCLFATVISQLRKHDLQDADHCVATETGSNDPSGNEVRLYISVPYPYFVT